MDGIAIINGGGEGCDSRKPSSTGWVVARGGGCTIVCWGGLVRMQKVDLTCSGGPNSR